MKKFIAFIGLAFLVNCVEVDKSTNFKEEYQREICDKYSLYANTMDVEEADTLTQEEKDAQDEYFARIGVNPAQLQTELSDMSKPQFHATEIDAEMRTLMREKTPDAISAAAVGVGALKSETKSQIVKSIS